MKTFKQRSNDLKNKYGVVDPAPIVERELSDSAKFTDMSKKSIARLNAKIKARKQLLKAEKLLAKKPKKQ